LTVLRCHIAAFEAIGGPLPPSLRARPEDGRHDQLGIFQTALLTALLGRITQASTLGISRNTVKDYVAAGGWTPYRQRQRKKGARWP
jgi:hypothetical protein